MQLLQSYMFVGWQLARIISLSLDSICFCMMLLVYNMPPRTFYLHDADERFGLGERPASTGLGAPTNDCLEGT